MTDFVPICTLSDLANEVTDDPTYRVEAINDVLRAAASIGIEDPQPSTEVGSRDSLRIMNAIAGR